MLDPIVGIDLGTSNTVVAHADATGNAHVLADTSGYKIHPSVVSFHPNGGVVVGASAKQRKVIDPKNTIYSVKRLIGRSFGSNEVQAARQRMPYQIKEGANQLPLIVTRGGEFAVPEISAIVLDHVKHVASTALATEVRRAVITVPAAFNDAQRSATATAGSIAGLNVVRVLNEPTAAALAYGHTRNLKETIAVYDFGGGTFDITILKLEDQVYEVLGTAGDTFLGGDDLDERLVDRMVQKFLEENRVDLRSNELSMMRLRAVAEQTKIELTRRSRAVVRVDEIAYGARGKPLDLLIEIRRDELINQIADIIDRTFPVCQEALSLAGLGIDRIDDVILVGGTTKIPYVRDQVAKFFGKAPRTDVNPEDAVAVGAALQASALERLLRRNAAPQPIADRGPPSDETEDLDDVPEGETETYEPGQLPAAAQAARSSTGPGNRTERPAARGAHVDRISIRGAKPPAPPPLPAGRVKHGSVEHKTLQGAPPAHLPAEHKTLVDTVSPLAPSSAAGVTEHKTLVDTVSPLAPSSAASVTEHKTLLGTAPDPRPHPSDLSTRIAAIPEQSTHIAAPPEPRPSRAPAPPAPPPAPRTAKQAAPTHAPSVPASTPHARTQIVERANLSPGPGEMSGGALLSDADFPNLPTEHVFELEPPPSPPGPTASTTSRGFTPPPVAPVVPEHARPAPVPFGAAGILDLVDAPVPAGRATGAMPLPTGILDVPRIAELSAEPGGAWRAGTSSPVILDVTPRGLGIGTVAGFCEELIRRNSRLPTETRKVFVTSRDDQDAVRIIVVQGESRRMTSNTVIADLRLDNLPRRPRGETSIEVTFMIDASGILNVRALDAQTGREQRASLDIVGSIAQEDVSAARERVQALRR